MKKLRVSSKLNLHYFPKDNLEEYNYQGLLFHKKLGFDASDYSLSQINFLENGWEECIEALIRDSEKVGIKIENCHIPFLKMKCTPEEEAAHPTVVRRSIDAAKMLGVDYAVIHPNGFTEPLDKFNRREKFESTMKYLAPVAEYAAQKGVNIVVENMRLVPEKYPVHRYCQDPDELCEVADALGVGVCWDFGHANICGLKQSEALAYIGSRLKVLHVNDNLGIGDDHLAPFLGNTDWADAMHGLKLCGFDGLFNYEIAMDHLPKEVKEDYARYLVNAAHKLIEMIQ